MLKKLPSGWSGFLNGVQTVLLLSLGIVATLNVKKNYP